MKNSLSGAGSVRDPTALGNNTLVVVASDNGAMKSFEGSGFPQRGDKGSMANGGVHNFAFLYGPESLVPSRAVGTTYSGLVHITDIFAIFVAPVKI